MVGGLEALRGGRERESGVDIKGVIVVLLLIVVAIGGLAEILASRTVSEPDPPRAVSWTILIQAGDAARVRGDEPGARQAYLKALFQARAEGSTVGVLRAAEGFKRLGDHDVVEQALRVAAALGPRDQDRDARLQSLRDRLDAADALPISVHGAR
jgi:hypothetical protein